MHFSKSKINVTRCINVIEYLSFSSSLWIAEIWCRVWWICLLFDCLFELGSYLFCNSILLISLRSYWIDLVTLEMMAFSEGTLLLSLNFKLFESYLCRKLSSLWGFLFNLGWKLISDIPRLIESPLSSSESS
jgi:hypothetical protein